MQIINFSIFIKNSFLGLVSDFVNSAVPLTCISCDKVLDIQLYDIGICCDCEKSLEYLDDSICGNCGRELSIGEVCFSCQINNSYFSSVLSLYPYEYVKNIIINLKFNHMINFSSTIAYYMSEFLKTYYKDWLDDIDLVIPVPMYYKREKNKGYNQSDLIGREIATMCNLSYDKELLKRIKYKGTQNKTTNAKQRIANVKDAFGMGDNKNCKNKIILLIDDIFTTGNTCKQCSKILIENGALEVRVFTFAASIHRY